MPPSRSLASWMAGTLNGRKPPVSQSECPACGALRYQRCRNLASPGISRQLTLSPEATGDQEGMDRRPPTGLLAVSRPERCRVPWQLSR